jgi:hypothetical protein
MSTTVTVSESRLATKAVFGSASCSATDTGSRPVNTAPSNCRCGTPCASTPVVKTSRRASGVFSASRCAPSGVSSSGRTGPDSKLGKGATAVDCTGATSALGAGAWGTRDASCADDGVARAASSRTSET